LVDSAKNTPAKWTAINASKGSLKIQKCGGCKAQTLKMYIKYFEMAVTKQMPYFWLAQIVNNEKFIAILVQGFLMILN